MSPVSLTPTSDSDIRIEVWLPASRWNGKLQSVGNGAWAGAPARISATHSTNGAVDRTRPLCAYPQMARYRGAGSLDDEANFVCAAPLTPTREASGLLKAQLR